jgi:hypothetical protein
MDKSDFQKVVHEAVVMAEKTHSDPVIVGAVANATINLALRPYVDALRFELLHGKERGS